MIKIDLPLIRDESIGRCCESIATGPSPELIQIDSQLIRHESIAKCSESIPAGGLKQLTRRRLPIDSLLFGCSLNRSELRRLQRSALPEEIWKSDVGRVSLRK